MTGVVVVVAVLAVYRLTMLVVADELTAPIRERIIGRYVHPTHELVERPGADPTPDDGGWPYSAQCRCGERWVGDEWSDVMSEANGHTNPHYGEMTTGPRWLILLDCYWCASVWIAVPVCWSGWSWGTEAWWFVPAVALAASAVTGILATFAKPQS